jgi:peroxiredoxin
MQTSNSFKIIGKVKDIPDSAVVILKNNNIVLDSTLIIKGEFELKGSLKEPGSAILKVPITGDYKVFWIENSEIVFNAEAGKFFDAKIIGSQLQNESDSLLAKADMFFKAQDSLLNMLTTNPADVNRDSILNEVDDLRKKELREEYLVVKNNPSSLISAHLLDVFKTTWDIKKVLPLYSSFTDKVKNSNYGKSIKRYIELYADLKIGDKFANFESTDTDGKIVKLSDIKAKAVLLDFWASSCFPCRKENKHLVKAYDDYKKYGFEIFGVSGDSKKEDWLDAIKKDKLIWTNVFDGKGMDSKPFLIYGINGIPDNFLINSEGIIVARNLRGDDLRKKLDELLK